MTTKPERILALEEAARLTGGDRDADYGPPIVNLRASGELKEAMRRNMVRDLSTAEVEALDMVLTKIGRIITGPKPKRDNYIDGAAYMAIAWEAAKHDIDEMKEISDALDNFFEPTGSTRLDLTETANHINDALKRKVVYVDDEKPSDT